MTGLPVNLEREDQLARRMAELGVRELDLEETFVRSGGPGGQNVNKTATCVILRHRPTGLQVRCQDSRQQGPNRVRARQLLLDKIAARRQAALEAERERRERIRRQKRPRPRRVKERILADKAHRATRKQLRRPLSAE